MLDGNGDIIYCENPICEWEAVETKQRGEEEIYLCGQCATAWDMALVEPPQEEQDAISVEQQTCFVINDHHVEIVEVDGLGFDIYVDHADDPINLGEIAYFTQWPTWKDLLPYVNKV